MNGMSWPNSRNSVSEERVNAVQLFGFTERQARFLVHVLVHSGVFLERQYRASARVAHGQKTHDFLAKLVGRGYAKAITPGALHRGRLYHVHFKPMYRAIGEPDNRHRKAAELGRFVERLMVLGLRPRALAMARMLSFCCSPSAIAWRSDSLICS